MIRAESLSETVILLHESMSKIYIHPTLSGLKNFTEYVNVNVIDERSHLLHQLYCT